MHPIWDVALHYTGPGRAFAPAWYTTSCLTFDLMVAGVTAIAVLIGTHLSVSSLQKTTPTLLAPVRPSPCTCGCCTVVGARAA